MFEEKEVVLLMSGGLDSVTLYLALHKVYNVKKVHILYFDYGQPNVFQEQLAIEENIVNSMYKYTFEKIKLPEWYNDAEIPFRNRSFISLASLYAVKHSIKSIFIGAISYGENYNYTTGDTSFMYDCTEDFIKSINSDYEYILNDITIYAPLHDFSKYEVYCFGRVLGMVSYHNCTSGQLVACGRCNNCKAMADIRKLVTENNILENISEMYYSNPYLRLPKYRGEVRDESFFKYRYWEK